MGGSSASLSWRVWRTQNCQHFQSSCLMCSPLTASAGRLATLQTESSGAQQAAAQARTAASKHEADLQVSLFSRHCNHWCCADSEGRSCVKLADYAFVVDRFTHAPPSSRRSHRSPSAPQFSVSVYVACCTEHLWSVPLGNSPSRPVLKSLMMLLSSRKLLFPHSCSTLCIQAVKPLQSNIARFWSAHLCSALLRRICLEPTPTWRHTATRWRLKCAA